jgi:hypothetical protein
VVNVEVQIGGLARVRKLTDPEREGAKSYKAAADYAQIGGSRASRGIDVGIISKLDLVGEPMVHKLDFSTSKQRRAASRRATLSRRLSRFRAVRN